jgi:hypothetical protein
MHPLSNSWVNVHSADQRKTGEEVYASKDIERYSGYQMVSHGPKVQTGGV